MAAFAFRLLSPGSLILVYTPADSEDRDLTPQLLPAKPKLAWPVKLPSLGITLLVLGLTAVYSLFAAFVPVADDELYYWCWAQNLQWSYYDHPLMSALFIRASCELFGNSIVAVRLPAAVTTAIVFAIILRITRPKAVVWYLLLCPLFSLGACIITPDTPLLAFWALYVFWLVKTHEKSDYRMTNWLLGGLLLGCGVLGKYTMALAVPAAFLSFLLAAPLRSWLAGFVVHGVVGVVVAAPILIFNIQHDFKPLLYQWQHSMGHVDPSLRRFGDFVGIQVLLFGTLPVTLLPWVLWNWKRFAAEPRLRVALCLYGFPFAFFLYKATRGHLEGNWALASYIAFWPLAAEWYERNRGTAFGRWGLRVAFLPPAVAVIALTIHLVQPFPFITPHADRITRQSEKYELAKQIAAKWREAPLPMYSETYQWVALLLYNGIGARQIEGVSRASHFTQVPQRITDEPEAYVLWENTLSPKLLEGLSEPVLVAEFPLKVRGETATTFYLWKVRRIR